MIALVILAAGRGSRLGGVAKALLPPGSGTGATTFLENIIRTAAVVDVPPARTVVVTGAPFAGVVAKEARRLAIATVENPAPERGMGSSVATGFEYAVAEFGDCEAALLWPVDHALVEAKTLEALLAVATSGHIVIPTHDGRGGHPAVVGRTVWNELLGAGEAAEGARSIFRADPARAVRVDVGDAAVVRDVDTREELPA